MGCGGNQNETPRRIQTLEWCQVVMGGETLEVPASFTDTGVEAEVFEGEL